jgi:hypothetical protein
MGNFRSWNRAFLFALLLLAGCATVPVYNVQNAPIPDKNLTMEQVERAIVRAGVGLGWRMDPVAPGKMRGTLHLRRHVIVVGISYDTKSFSINYESSENMNYENGQIHKNYNSWVQNLERDIQRNLLAP